MNATTVSVDYAGKDTSRRVAVLLGASLAVATRVPVVCYADAEVLDALGLKTTPANKHEIETALEKYGVALVPRESGVTTAPEELLHSPLGISRHVVGMPSDAEAKQLAEYARANGVDVLLAFSADDGAEMFATEGQTILHHLDKDNLRRRRIRPADCGVPDNATTLLSINSPKESARALERVAEGHGSGHNQPPSAARAVYHAVAINAALILFAAGLAVSLQDGAEAARADISAGVMATTLTNLRP